MAPNRRESRVHRKHLGTKPSLRIRRDQAPDLAFQALSFPSQSPAVPAAPYEVAWGGAETGGIGALSVPCLAHKDRELSPHESAESKARKRFCIRNGAGTHVAPGSAELPWVVRDKRRMDFRRTGACWKNALGEDFSAVAQCLQVFGAACLIPLNQRAGFLGLLSIRHPQALPFQRAPFLGSSTELSSELSSEVPGSGILGRAWPRCWERAGQLAPWTLC